MTGNPAESAIAKASRRLIPFLVLCYAVNFLDRVNVGFAALAMNEDLGFTPEVFGFGAGIFFAGYILFEVPSNLALARFGARIWIARIMISWGLVATAMAFVAGETSFYALRFALGVAEAGFFPGIILYLTYWFPREERARIVSLFMTAVPIATVVGGPLRRAAWLARIGRDCRLAVAVYHRRHPRSAARHRGPQIPHRPAEGRALAHAGRADRARAAARGRS
jgi:ACS family tartrate transporter-like MFS transporter